jgi:hypothetical protein
MNDLASNHFLIDTSLNNKVEETFSEQSPTEQVQQRSLALTSAVFVKMRWRINAHQFRGALRPTAVVGEGALSVGRHTA